MNKVIAPPVPDNQFKKGDILCDTSEKYLLCYFIDEAGNAEWIAMGLHDGHFWSKPKGTAAEAAQGLTLYKRDATLTIS